MAYTINPNSGSLFINDRKNADNQPDYNGTAKINGVTYRISAWKKVGKSGKKYFSLAFSLPTENTENTASRSAVPQSKPTYANNNNGGYRQPQAPAPSASDDDFPW